MILTSSFDFKTPFICNHIFDLSIMVCNLFFCPLNARETLRLSILKPTVFRNSLIKASLKHTKKIEAYLRDTEGSVPDHHDEARNATKHIK